jgi:hypothetical protein
MEVRPPKDRGRQEVEPADSEPFEAEYPDWVDVPRDVALSLIAQGWENRAAKKAAKTRAENEQAAEPAPDADDTASSGEES